MSAERAGEPRASERLRATVVRTVAHGERVLLTRRYLSDGRILESSQANPSDAAHERAIGRFGDLREARANLRAAGWLVSERPDRRARVAHFVALAALLTALGVLWTAASIAIVLGTVAGLAALAALLLTRLPAPVRLVGGALLLGTTAALWFVASPLALGGSLVLIAVVTWTVAARAQ